jgi:outer membrane protein TolC
MSPKLLLALGLLSAAHPAGALQPLETFLQGARAGSPDNAEAKATRAQLDADAQAALGGALPRLSLRGSYTRNEVNSLLQLTGPSGPPVTVTLTPFNQLDASATLGVPLVDLASFARIGAARTGARASALQATATELQVESLVCQDYYQLVANLALVDVDRARAEVERNVQQVVASELQVSLVARSLQSRTGVVPGIDSVVALADDLHDEPPLERFQPPDEALPALAAAIQGRVAADEVAHAQKLTLVPSLAALATERVTSFEGLGGHQSSWQAVVALTWSIDLTTVAAMRSTAAAADGARAREERARLAARDDIHRAFRMVGADIARSRSARVQADVSARAATLALERYQVGEGSQLDLLQAQRDAFAADAGRIQADADLVNARDQLRIAAGQSLLGTGEGGTP